MKQSIFTPEYIMDLKRKAKASSVFKDINKESIRFIANHRGEDRQLCKLQEEAAEVIQAVNKYRYHTSENGKPEKMDLLEELADCRIMLEQAVYLLSKKKPDAEEVFYNFIGEKLVREVTRIENE